MPRIVKLERLILILLAIAMVLGLTNLVSAALIDNGDGTITDDDIGIMWLQTPPPDDVYAGPARMTWDEAMTWAENLVFAGYDNWRLPSANDFDTGLPDTVLNSVNNEWGHLYGVEWGNPGGTADILPMTGYWSGGYWTSTEDPGDASQAYAFFVSYDGYWLNDVVPKSDWSVFVTAVRDIEEGPLPNGIPEFSLTIPVATSLAAAIYIVIRKRIGKS